MPDRVFSYEFRGKFANLTAGFAAAGKGAVDLGDKLTRLDKQGENYRRGLTAVGDTAGRAGLVAAAGVGAIVLASANFEQAMSSVQAATHETAENMDLLRQAALDAGASTKFSATEAAGAIENLAKAGVSTQDILGGGLAGALDLAAAGNLDVAEAAGQAATAMTQFGKTGSDVPHIADLLAAGAGKAQGEVTDLGMALNQTGLVANQVGLSIEETTGGLAAFASAGLLGSDAGTSFKTMLGALTPNSVKAKEEMERLGISAYDAQGNFIGLAEFAGNLQSSLSGLTNEQRQATLELIFGQDAVRAASVLYEQGEQGVRDWTNAVNDQGYAAETAAIQMDNLKGDVEELGGALETALIGAGEGSQGMLRSVTQRLTSAVNAFNDLPPAIQNTTTGLLGLTAVTGGAAWFGAKVITGISDTRQALDDLGVSAGRTGRAMRTLSAAGAAAAAVLVVNESLAKLVRSYDEAGPAIEGLTNDLLNINTNEGISAAVESLDDLQAVIATLSDSSAADKIGGIYDKIPGGSSFADIAPGLAGARQEAREAQSAIESLDAALANLVSQGAAPAAADAIERLADVYGLSADEQKELLDLLPGYQSALDSSATSAQVAASATEDLGGAAAQSAEEIQQQAEALEDAKSAARDVAEQFFNLGDSLDDSEVSLREWVQDMEQAGRDLRNFRVNAEEAADRGLRRGLIDALETAGPAGAMRMRQLANATDAEIKRANQAWGAGQREVKRFVDTVESVPPGKSTNLDVNTGSAFDKLRSLKSELAGMKDKYISVWITERHRDAAAASRGGSGVGGTRRAGGGPIVGPGGPRDDAVPIMASNGEFMMSAAAVDYYGLSTMFDLNARRLADGGSVDDGRDRDRPTARRRSAGISIDVAETGKQLRRLTRELALSEKVLAAETKQRDDLVSQQASIRGAVAGGLTTDIWARPANVWGGAVWDPTAAANANADRADEFTALVAQLEGKGLDGPALAQVIASGDIERARLMASQSEAELDLFEAAINRMDASLRAAGQVTTGALGIDTQLAEQVAQVKQGNQILKEIRQAVKQAEKANDRAQDRNAEAVKEGVNGAAGSGKRRRRKGPGK